MDDIELLLKERRRKERVRWAYVHGCIIMAVSVLTFLVVMAFV